MDGHIIGRIRTTGGESTVYSLGSLRSYNGTTCSMSSFLEFDFSSAALMMVASSSIAVACIYIAPKLSSESALPGTSIEIISPLAQHGTQLLNAPTFDKTTQHCPGGV